MNIEGVERVVVTGSRLQEGDGKETDNRYDYTDSDRSGDIHETGCGSNRHETRDRPDGGPNHCRLAVEERESRYRHHKNERRSDNQPCRISEIDILLLSPAVGEDPNTRNESKKEKEGDPFLYVLPLG